MPFDFRNKTDVETWVGLMLAAARDSIEKTGALIPTAVLVLTNHEGNIIETGVTDMVEGKVPFDAASEASWISEIRAKAKQGQAIAVITAGEAFTLKMTPELDPAVVTQSFDAQDRSQLDEVVAIEMEHKLLGNFGYMANVIRGDGEKPKLTPFRQRSMQARFGSLLNS